jgi:hypothetical protein
VLESILEDIEADQNYDHTHSYPTVGLDVRNEESADFKHKNNKDLYMTALITREAEKQFQQ